MISDFDKYKMILLDASFFRAKISPEVQEVLQKKQIYVAGTFSDEINQYRFTMDSVQGACYRNNLDVLNRLPAVRQLDFAGAKELAEGLNDDTWGFVKLLERMHVPALLMSEDDTLIQRVILENRRIDIYNLFTNERIPWERFGAIRQSLEYSPKKEDAVPAPENTKVQEGSTVYLKNGRGISLGKELESSGMEGRLYRVPGAKPMVAKIFRKRILTRDKWENLEKITSSHSFLRYAWAVLPSELVYYDSGGRFPAGFLEPFVETGCNLSDKELYLGNLNLPPEIMGTRMRETLELCVKAVRQVCALNCCGFLVSDFNIRNFSLPVNESAAIQMWDTDSYAYGTYFSNFWDGNPMSRNYDTTRKTDAIQFCNEALYQFIFMLISLGDHPISEFDGQFKYLKPEYPAYFRKRLFPENLWELFTDTFTGKKEASPQLLLSELCSSLEELKTNPARNPSYEWLLAEELEMIRSADPQPVEEEESQTEDEDFQPDEESIPGYLIVILFILAVIVVILGYFCFFT